MGIFIDACKPVVVTGATSFIGAALVRALLAQGRRVYAVVRPGSPKRGVLPENETGLRMVQMDMDAYATLPEIIGERCACFFHFCWQGAGSANRTLGDVQRGNVDQSLCALDAARALGCARFLLPGSQAEYGVRHSLTAEDAPCAPVSEYGKAKVELYREAMARRADGMEYIHARVYSVYGPGDHVYTLPRSCVRAFLAGDAIELSACDQMWNYLYITDAAQALVSLGLHDGALAEDGLYNVAGEACETRALRAYVERLHALCSGRGKPLFSARPQNAEGAADLMPDISRLQAATGWKPCVSFDEGARALIEFERNCDRHDANKNA